MHKSAINVQIRSDYKEKLRYISKHENRSMNGKIFCLIQKCIIDYETEHGKIELNEQVKLTHQKKPHDYREAFTS